MGPIEEAIAKKLAERSLALLERPYETVQLTSPPEANALVNDLVGHPHAFVLACLMDRQVQSEIAWRIPHEIRQRLGTFEMRALRDLSLDQMEGWFVGPPALHRHPSVMAAIFHAGIGRIVDTYGGDASRIWPGAPSSSLMVRRFLEFKGAGPKIATMAVNILARDFKIPVSDRYSIDISPDVHTVRVFRRLGLIRPDASGEELIYRARELNPKYPGVYDLAAWEVGKQWCRPRGLDCAACYMADVCAAAEQTTPSP